MQISDNIAMIKMLIVVLVSMSVIRSTLCWEVATRMAISKATVKDTDPGLIIVVDPFGIHECMTLELFTTVRPLLEQGKKTIIFSLSIVFL